MYYNIFFVNVYPKFTLTILYQNDIIILKSSWFDLTLNRGEYMEGYLPYIWLVLALILGIVEISTAQLVSIWFVAAAMVTSLCAATFLSDSLWLQIVVFVVVSAAALVLTRPIVRKIRNSDKAKTNSDRYIGKVGIVTIDIDWKTATGQVEVEGSRWSAKSADNQTITAGTNVTVEEIQGVKLIVKPLSE